MELTVRAPFPFGTASVRGFRCLGQEPEQRSSRPLALAAGWRWKVVAVLCSTFSGDWRADGTAGAEGPGVSGQLAATDAVSAGPSGHLRERSGSLARGRRPAQKRRGFWGSCEELLGYEEHLGEKYAVQSEQKF